MSPFKKPLFAAISVLALVGCGDRQLGSTWNQEAGAFLDEGGFGNATMNNMLAQKCQSRIPKGRIIYEPKVVRAPVGAPKPYIAQVHCAGYLNGKYAQVIFQEYVASATEIPPESADAVKR